METKEDSVGDNTYYSPSRTFSDTPSMKYPHHAIESLASILYINLDIADRTYHFKTYKSCFIGSELVDYLINNDYCSSRSDGVTLGNILLQNQYIEHVLNEHNFKDKYLFYRFKMHDQKTENQVNSTTKQRLSSSSPSSSSNVTRSRAISSPCIDNQSLLTKTVRQKQNQSAAKLMYLRLMDELASIPFDCLDDANTTNSGFDYCSLMALAFVLYRNLSIKDRTYHFKTYKKCFIGSDLVDFLVDNINGFCLNRLEAVTLGNNLFEHGYIRHVLNEHEFEDKYFFYCFRNPAEKFKYGFQKIEDVEDEHLDVSGSNDVDLSNIKIVEEYAVIVADV